MIALLASLALAILTGCRGGGEIKCDDTGNYVAAGETRRISVPNDLDELDILKEAPLPEASPRSDRPAGAGCLEAPPRIADNQ